MLSAVSPSRSIPEAGRKGRSTGKRSLSVRLGETLCCAHGDTIKKEVISRLLSASGTGNWFTHFLLHFDHGGDYS